MVVPVLTINCQVSEKPNSGPVAAHKTMTITQKANVSGLPVAWATLEASSANILEIGMLGRERPGAWGHAPVSAGVLSVHGDFAQGPRIRLFGIDAQEGRQTCTDAKGAAYTFVARHRHLGQRALQFHLTQARRRT